MLLTSLAMAGAMLTGPENLGPWRVVEETSAQSIAIQMGKRAPSAGTWGTVYVLQTYAEPRPLRGGGTFRQLWIELLITCPGGEREYWSDVEWAVADPAQPLPQPVEGPIAPIAVRSFNQEPYGPLALAICNGERADGPVIEGDWAAVLAALLARSDAGRP